MPAKNRTKDYVAGGYYHIYNRGVNKQIIFSDRQDYATLLSYLKTYLSPKNEDEFLKQLALPDTDYKTRDKILRILRLNNFNDSLSLLAYCLIPNHFHFLVKQKWEDTIDKFMNSLCTRYSMFFNRKYSRIGPLFQGVYKAVLVESEEQLLHLSRYIHKQAIIDSQGLASQIPQPSSYPNYLGQISQEWVQPGEILNSFKSRASYQSFVEEQKDAVTELIVRLTLED